MALRPQHPRPSARRRTPSSSSSSRAAPDRSDPVHGGHRRAVWDALAASCFGATAEEAREAEAADDWVETHTAEEAGLAVFSVWGRWIAVWRVLDEPAEAPERFRYDVVSLHEDPGRPYGLGLSEV